MRVILGTTKDTQFLAVYVKAINWTRSLLVSRGWGRGRCGRLFIRDRSIDQHWSPAKCHLQMSSEVGPSARRPAVIPRPWSARSQSPLALGQQGHSHPRPWSTGSQLPLAFGQQGHSHPRLWSARSQSPLAFGQQGHSHPSPLVSNFTVTTRPWCRQSQSPHDLGVNNVSQHSPWYQLGDNYHTPFVSNVSHHKPLVPARLQSPQALILCSR